MPQRLDDTTGPIAPVAGGESVAAEMVAPLPLGPAVQRGAPLPGKRKSPATALKLVCEGDSKKAQTFVRLEGKFVRTDDDGITIACDGNNWSMIDPAGMSLGTPAPLSGTEEGSIPGIPGEPPEGCWQIGEDRYHLSFITSAAMEAVRVRESLRPFQDWLEHLEGFVGPVHGRIYDLGCGAGSFEKVLGGLGRDVHTVGMDLDPAAVAAAKISCPSLPFRTANASKLHECPTDAGKASGVWASFVAAHFPPSHLKSVLLQFSWLLKPGGWLFLADLHGLWSLHRPFKESRWAKSFREFDEDLPDNSKFDPFVGDRLQELCKKIGLEVLDQREWTDGEFVFQGPANETQLALWMARLNSPETKRLFKKRFQDFAKQAYEQFSECIKSPEHYCHGKVKVLICCKPKN